MTCAHGKCPLLACKSGYCNAHYIRKRRGKNMDAPVRRVGLDPERFWEKVDKSPGCWEWTAFRDSSGYGRFMINNIPRLAHRVSYARVVGSIPPGMEIDHMCHNRACVNPSHLRLVTRSLNGQNMRAARIDSESGIRGVRQRKDTKRWVAEATLNGERAYLGTFTTADEANASITEWRRVHMPYSIMDQRIS